MESRLCKVHKNKTLNCFCWNCQQLICVFCMQEHKAYKHKTYSLLSISKKNIPSPIKLSSPPINYDHSNSESKLNTIPEKQKKESKGIDTELCIKCSQPISSKDIQLKCKHWMHRNCLGEYFYC